MMIAANQCCILSISISLSALCLSVKCLVTMLAFVVVTCNSLVHFCHFLSALVSSPQLTIDATTKTTGKNRTLCGAMCISGMCQCVQIGLLFASSFYAIVLAPLRIDVDFRSLAALQREIHFSPDSGQWFAGRQVDKRWHNWKERTWFVHVHFGLLCDQHTNGLTFATALTSGQVKATASYNNNNNQLICRAHMRRPLWAFWLPLLFFQQTYS